MDQYDSSGGSIGSQTKKKLLVAGAILAVVAGYFYFGLGSYLNLDFIQQNRTKFLGFYEANPLTAIASYCSLYILITGASLPGAAVATLLGAALFGFWPALGMVSFSSTVGATVAFLAARYLFRDAITARFGERLQKIDRGIERDGAFYLFTLRLIPAVPFFVINTVSGLTNLPTWTFFWVSQVGMLPGTAVYVYAGTQLATISSLEDIFSPQVIAAFVLLGIFPLLMRKVLSRMKPEVDGTD